MADLETKSDPPSVEVSSPAPSPAPAVLAGQQPTGQQPAGQRAPGSQQPIVRQFLEAFKVLDDLAGQPMPALSASKIRRLWNTAVKVNISCVREHDRIAVNAGAVRQSNGSLQFANEEAGKQFMIDLEPFLNSPVVKFDESICLPAEILTDVKISAKSLNALSLFLIGEVDASLSK